MDIIDLLNNLQEKVGFDDVNINNDFNVLRDWVNKVHRENGKRTYFYSAVSEDLSVSYCGTYPVWDESLNHVDVMRKIEDMLKEKSPGRQFVFAAFNTL